MHEPQKINDCGYGMRVVVGKNQLLYLLFVDVLPHPIIMLLRNYSRKEPITFFC